jgi:hypothetical protein
MKHVRISGEHQGISLHHSHRLFRKHIERGRHTVLIGLTEISNSKPDHRMSKCDVLITVHRSTGPLTIEETTCTL